MEKSTKEITISPFCCSDPGKFEEFIKSEYNMFSYYSQDWLVNIHEEMRGEKGVYVSASLSNVNSDILVPIRQARFHKVDRVMCELYDCAWGMNDENKILEQQKKYANDQMNMISKSNKEIILNSERAYLKKFTKRIAIDFFQFLVSGEIHISLSDMPGYNKEEIDELIINTYGHYQYSPRFGVHEDYRLLRTWRPIYGTFD